MTHAPIPAPTAIAQTILSLAAARGPAASIAPEDVAKALLPENWRPLLGAVRRAAAGLATAGLIDILRKGKPIEPAELRGVIRLRIRAVEPDAPGDARGDATAA